MKTLLALLFSFLVALPSFSVEKSKKYLITKVKESTWKRDLPEAYILIYDKEGNVADTLHTLAHKYPNVYYEQSRISIPFNPDDTILAFDLCAPGYQTETVVWNIEPFKKRETYREMPVLFMHKAIALKEVTVTASKIKFYNKGDTVVYNADAFQLAEGSMLDALISQLPGAKIDENGRITVNGEFVESLLLNGKELFKDDHQIMLENIGAYTVKNIEVYKGHSKEEKWKEDPNPPTHLTMDVKLKKEYSNGWIVNVQGGYGTKNRYLGRLFTSWFSPTTSVAITGSVNNLNDSRNPGKTDSWTPDKMPSGLITVKTAGLSYNHQSTDDKLDLAGSATVRSNSFNSCTSTSRTNFFSGGNTFDRSFSDAHNKSLFVSADHSVYYKFTASTRGTLYGRGYYSKNDNSNSSISAAFNTDMSDLSKKALETLYSAPLPGALESVINRSITRSDGSNSTGYFYIVPSIAIKLPSADWLTFNMGIDYTTRKNHIWNDYNINFGSDPVPAETRRRYTDNTPNHEFNISPSVAYRFTLANGMSISLQYGFRFSHIVDNSYMFALDRLDDMGIYGVLPSGCFDVLDPSNSYTSTTYVNSHTLLPTFMWYKTLKKSRLSFMAFPSFEMKHSHLDYWRENKSYLVKRTDFLFTHYGYSHLVALDFDKVSGMDDMYSQSIKYQLEIATKSPQLMHLVDVVNDADPLNISLGNPDLHNAVTHTHTLKWAFTPYRKPYNNILSLSCEVINNALVRGYVYDTTTGVRRNRTYNVDGNLNLRALNFFNYEFGSKNQFSIASATDVAHMNNADMIGVDQEEPQKSEVKNLTLGQDLIFTYRIGQQSISAQGTASHRHTTSDRADFATINSQHYKYGASANFKLPAGIGLSTDFFFYKRVGYGVKELDTTDKVWNMRLTYTPKGGHWVFAADGYDLLHKLSNVHYAVTASGRTVSYTNSLPRYFMFTVQYRLNIQPRK